MSTLSIATNGLLSPNDSVSAGQTATARTSGHTVAAANQARTVRASSTTTTVQIPAAAQVSQDSNTTNTITANTETLVAATDCQCP